MTKVGKDVAEAIYQWPNNTVAFAKVPKLGIKVQRGMTHDGLGKYLSQIIKKAPGPTVDIVKLLKDTKTDVVVNYLPVGSENLDLERIFDFSEQAQLNNVTLQNKAFHLLGASLRQGVKAG